MLPSDRQPFPLRVCALPLPTMTQEGLPMIRGLFGDSTLPSMLRGGLQELTETQKGISERVSGLMKTSTANGFTEAHQAAVAKAAQTEADVQREMASLADTQLRFEADAQLL